MERWLLVVRTYLVARAFKKLARSLVSATRSILERTSSTFAYTQVQVPMCLFDRKRGRVMLYLHTDTSYVFCVMANERKLRSKLER